MGNPSTDAPAGGNRGVERLIDFSAPGPSVEERMAAGKSLRDAVPLDAHAEYRPAPEREDPVAILEQQAKTRLKYLVPIRHARMLASPFAFLRGSAAVMAADLAHTPVSGLRVQACGDAHVGNFGVFASAERNLVFGINDFDETLPGAWEWDLKRLAASAAVAVSFLGGDKTLCEETARVAVTSYRKHMREFARMSHLDVWYESIDEKGILAALSSEAREEAKQIMAKARRRNHLQVLEKKARLVDDQHHIVEDKPFISRETKTAEGHPIAKVLDHTMHVYFDSLPDHRKPLFARYRAVDAARKIVGVGSVGTRCWIVLMIGSDHDDPLFLQYKEAQRSVLAPYVAMEPWDCEGRRVVVGQRIIQGAPDILLGWGIQIDGTHFYMRQLRDMKGGWEFDEKTTRVKRRPEYAKLCGWALALAHAKSGDAAMISGYLGKGEDMDDAVGRFAMAYAEQTDRDYDALVKAAKAKRIPVAKESY
jgi:uncharacterized protein (DUF2252 family)